LDIPFWQINNEGNLLENIDQKYRSKILNPVESITLIDSINNKETLTLKENHYKVEDFKTLRLNQEWFWDNHQKKLFIHLKTTSLLTIVNDDAGNFLYFKPLFYRKTED
jgi:hypothetical protein